ncbi:MAG: sigma-70 family RNA polymerase sigma factor, partial [Myxococcota bacterium]
MTHVRTRATVPIRMESDEELMRAYVAGDDAAFSELFERYAPMLLRIMRRQLRDEDAQEIVQQTFLQMHRARNDFDTTRKLRPWLMTIAYNLRRELYRRRGRKPEAALEVEPVADDHGDLVERASEAARLRRALLELPAGQREVIEMHWF